MIEQAVAPWTAHNIRLPDGTVTAPQFPLYGESDLRWVALRPVLVELFQGYLMGRQAVDLGCLEGGLSVELLRLGATVLGIEARAANMAKLAQVEAAFNSPRLHFTQDDVRHFTRERYGPFDLVCACGILYHLDDPVPWLRQLGALTTRVLVVDTHIAPLVGPAVGLWHLSGLQTKDGYQGRWYPDGGGVDDPWGAHVNERSFWLTKASLITALEAAGFPTVLEVMGYANDPVWNPDRSRLMLVAIKPGNGETPHAG